MRSVWCGEVLMYGATCRWYLGRFDEWRFRARRRVRPKQLSG